MKEEKTTILAVDDEPKIREVLASFLEAKGYRVLVAGTGGEALAILEAEAVGMVLLDLMLPDLPGEEVCARIRDRSRVPVIMLTAKVEEEDMLEGLGLGADDYITKPFGLKEVHARIEAVLRRCGGEERPLYRRRAFGDLVVDLERVSVHKGGEAVRLTPTEWRILTALLAHPGKVFTRDELIQAALGEEYLGFDRSIDSHIKNLRHKIEDTPREPVWVRTVHGLGYQFGGEA